MVHSEAEHRKLGEGEVKTHRYINVRKNTKRVMLRCRGGCGMGGVLVHIKALNHTQSHIKSSMFTKGVGGRYALDMLGRTQSFNMTVGYR